jgi:hypothetical protein
MALEDESKMENVPSSQPTIIGLSSISSSGKSHLLNNIKIDPALAPLAFYNDSDVLDRVTPGGLAAFRELAEDEKLPCREDALAHMSKECLNTQRTGVVAGHYMFWNLGGGRSVVRRSNMHTSKTVSRGNRNPRRIHCFEN